MGKMGRINGRRNEIQEEYKTGKGKERRKKERIKRGKEG